MFDKIDAYMKDKPPLLRSLVISLFIAIVGMILVGIVLIFLYLLVHLFGPLAIILLILFAVLWAAVHDHISTGWWK